MYKDKYGITDIKDTVCNALSISRDTDLDGKGMEIPVAVLLFTPTMRNTDDHHHIALDIEEAKRLKLWLHKFLKEHKAT